MNNEVEHWDPIFSGNISSFLRFWLSLKTSVLIFLSFFHFLLPFRFFNSQPLLTFSPLRSAVRHLLKRCAIYPPFCLSRFSSSLKPLKPDSPSQERPNSARRSSATTMSNADEESQPEYSPLVKGFGVENTTSRIRKIDVFIWLNGQYIHELPCPNCREVVPHAWSVRSIDSYQIAICAMARAG